MLAKTMSRFSPYALTVLRVVVGVAFLLHGLPKLQNLAGIAGFFGSLGVPAPEIMAPIVAAIEVGGGLLLILGVATRYVNLLHIAVMFVAILTVKLGMGFIAAGDQPGVGYELDLLLLAGSLVMLTLGPGAISVENSLLKREL